jgi:ECF transporter S component (folate family)
MARVAVLIALEIVLSRFLSISTPLSKIGFAFVPIAVCGFMFGPVWAAAAGAISDVIGAALFPSGPFFPGFTLTAALSGAVFGLFLYNSKYRIARIVCATLINCLVLSLLLNTLWLTIITGSSFAALMTTRVVQNAIMAPVQFTVLLIISKPLESYKRKFLSR